MATAFQALIADVFDKQRRPQATATLKAAFILGIVGGSVGLGWLADPYSPGRLIFVVAGVGLVVFGLEIVTALVGLALLSQISVPAFLGTEPHQALATR
jgi:MFS family permease